MFLAAAGSSDDSFFALVLLPIALAVIMISLGLSLTVADFKRVFVFPKGVAIGMANLVLISPLLAFGDRRAVRPRAGAGRRAGADGRRAGRDDGEPDDAPGQGRHRAVGDDDRDQQPGRGDHRAALPRAVDRVLRRGRGRRRVDGRHRRARVRDHDRAAGVRHVAQVAQPRARRARRADRQEGGVRRS